MVEGTLYKQKSNCRVNALLSRWNVKWFVGFLKFGQLNGNIRVYVMIKKLLKLFKFCAVKCACELLSNTAHISFKTFKVLHLAAIEISINDWYWICLLSIPFLSVVFFSDFTAMLMYFLHWSQASIRVYREIDKVDVKFSFNYIDYLLNFKLLCLE